MTLKQLRFLSNPNISHQLILNLLLVGAWAWLYAPLLDYLQIIFSREDFRTNQLILVGLLLLLVQRWQKSGVRPRLDAPPRLRPLPLSLLLGCSLGYLIVERFFDVNTVSAVLFGLGTYGLVGLWLAPGAWRRGFPAALLFIGTLPFGAHLQTFIGYPMRIATARIVQGGLVVFGVEAVGIDTILVFENGVSHIDLPCSGVSSLWTGALFLLGATWLEKRRFTPYWFLTAAIFVALLFLANLARVATLIVVGEVFNVRLLAEMLHVPLGVLGFVAACSAAVWLMRRQSVDEGVDNKPAPEKVAAPRQTAVLILAVALFALLYTPRPQTPLVETAVSWTFPTNMSTEPMPLSDVENDWLSKDGAESAERFRFRYGELSGTMILISSKTWRAHHRPERCFEVYGLHLNDSRTHLTTNQRPVRYVALGAGDMQDLYSATYWFQSSEQTTDDYGTRIWSDLSPQRERWVLVSVVFDGTVDPGAPEVAAFYDALHEMTAGFLARRGV